MPSAAATGAFKLTSAIIRPVVPLPTESDCKRSSVKDESISPLTFILTNAILVGMPLPTPLPTVIEPEKPLLVANKVLLVIAAVGMLAILAPSHKIVILEPAAAELIKKLSS